jgi:hypothetical protein
VPVPLDEYPLHQAPLSMAYPTTSDRNFYDRCYFNAHDRTGNLFLITGLGVYPNLGVIDAYATLRTGDEQVAVRMSDALGTDRLDQRVGPYRIEVVEPLEKIRIVCDAADHGLGFDLTWDGSFPAVEEPRHVWRRNGRITLDACRFAQVGSWSGEIECRGEKISVSPDTWLGTRDRSWGIRPVGEAEPAGRADEEPIEGFWWMYVPLRFDDYAIVLIVQEEPDGHRLMNEAVRVWPASTGRSPEQLGWPEIDIHYRSGSRHPEAATITLTERGGKPLTLEVQTLGYAALNSGPGYGGDPSWNHGHWRGRGFLEGEVYDMTDPAVLGRAPFGMIDHVARATLDGVEGWGMFEHACFGRNDPSGFTGWESVAP